MLAMFHMLMFLGNFMSFLSLLHLFHLLVLLMTSYRVHSRLVASMLRDGAWMPCSREGCTWARRNRRKRMLIWCHVWDGCGMIHARWIDRVLTRWALWDGHGWIGRVGHGWIGRVCIRRTVGIRRRSLIWPHFCLSQQIVSSRERSSRH